MVTTTHLVLKHQWYDLIASGKKKEEYRDCTAYWLKRFLGHPRWVFVRPRQGARCRIPLKDKKTIVFHRGYTSVTMEFEVSGMEYGYGRPDWGAPDKPCLIAVLGQRVK